MELLYFTDISQVQYVLDKEPQLFEIMRPITGDIVVASELERLNIPFIDEWDFLEPLDIERNAETATNLANTWWDERNGSTEYEGFPLSKFVSQDLVYPFEACLNAKVVYERIFQEYPINRISGYFLPSIGVIRTGPIPTHRAVRSVTQAILFWLAEKHNIPTTRLESGFPLSQGNLIKNRFPIGNLAVANPDKLKAGAEKIALIFNDGMPQKENLILKDSFKNLDGWRDISIWTSELKRIALEDKKEDVVKNKLQYAWESFNTNKTNYDGVYPEIFANPHLNFQFRRIWDEMQVAAEYGNVFLTFLDILKPSVVIFGHEAFTIERVLVRLAQNKNIPTISLLHGGLRFRIGYRGSVGNADSILVWNDIDIACLKFCGVNESRLHKIGCIRYEAKFKKYIKNITVEGTAIKNKSKQHIGIPSENPVILILTATINSGFAGPASYPRKHRETLIELLSLITSRKDLTFIIKAHPGYDYYELYRKMNALHLPNLIFLEKATLDEALEASDVCLMLNYFTTGALEAMLQRLPVIYLNNAVYPLSEWEDNVPDFIINRIHSVAELENKIDGLLNDVNLKERTFVEADKIIRQTLDFSKFSANDRLIDFIKNINITQQTREVSLSKVVHSICSEQSANNIKEEEIRNFLNEITLKHSIENVLYTFSFIAGSNNMGISSISRILNAFQNHFGKEKLLFKESLWWILLNSYISGYNYNSSKIDRYSSINMLAKFLMHPTKFIFLSSLTQKGILKYILRTSVGGPLSIAAINKLIYLVNNGAHLKNKFNF